MKLFNLETQEWEGEDDEPITSLQYLQSIYRDENRPVNVRIEGANAAVEEVLNTEKPPSFLRAAG